MQQHKTTVSSNQASTVKDIIGPVTVIGFTTAIAMWLAWLFAHQPWIDLPASIAGPGMAAFMIAGAIVAGLYGGRRLGWLAGASASLLAALLNLLIMGSLVAESIDGAAPAQGAQGLTPTATVAMLGFLGFSVAAGAVFGLLGGLKGNPTETKPMAMWAGRFAAVAALAVVPLLLLGGLVTSTGSGLAVPDWPGTYGANMFLYPIALMADPRIFLEHTHRLFGSLVGLTTISLAVFVWSTPDLRRRLDVPVSIAATVVIGLILVVGLRRHTEGDFGGMAFGGVAVAVALASVVWFLGALRLHRPAQAAAALILMVSAQGVLGGTRVTEANPMLGTIHGVLGQAYFASMVMFAAWLTPTARALRGEATFSGRARNVAWALLASLIVQLVLGAMYRHGSMAAEPQTWAGPALHGHMGFSIVVMVLAVVLGFMMLARGAGPDAQSDDVSRRRGAKVIGRFGWLVISVVVFQFALGWAAFAVVTGGERRVVPTAAELGDAPMVPVVTALVTFAHQANGALLLAAASASVVWCGLVASPRREAAPGVVPA